MLAEGIGLCFDVAREGYPSVPNPESGEVFLLNHCGSFCKVMPMSSTGKEGFHQPSCVPRQREKQQSQQISLHMPQMLAL